MSVPRANLTPTPGYLSVASDFFKLADTGHRSRGYV